MVEPLVIAILCVVLVAFWIVRRSKPQDAPAPLEVAPDSSDIRQRRLNRFATNQKQNPETPITSPMKSEKLANASHVAQVSSAPGSSLAEVPQAAQPVNVSPPAPAAQQRARQEPPVPKSIASDSPVVAKVLKSSDAPAKDDLPMWIDSAISEIFQFSLVPLHLQATGVRYLHLPGLAAELSSSSGFDRALLSQDVLESAIIERCQLPFASHMNPFIWLIDSFQRACGKSETLASLVSGQESKHAALESLKSICVTFSAMALTGSLSADSEEAKQCASDSFLRLLEADPKVSKTLPKDYLNRLTIHATEIDSISDLFDPILAQLRLKLSNTSGVDLNFTSSPLTLDTVCRPLRALTLLAAQSSLAMRIVRIPQFLISSQMQSGRTLEFQTLLGPALSLTSTNLTALNKMLPLARKHERFITPEIESQTNVLRGTLSDLQLTFFRLLQNLLRVNSESRDTCLKLISSYLTCNNARSKMQFDRSAVSTNGFMVNLSAALLQLCRPLFENDKITTVDLSYLVPSAHSRISFSDFDRLSATPAEVKEIENGCIGSSSAQPHSFVTEIFFLTHHCLHVGFDSVVREFYSLNDQIARGFSTLKQHPDDVQLKEQLLAKVAELHCMRACVVNHDFLRPLGQFYESTCSLFMQRIESEDERQAALMRLIPEYIVDGMIKYFDLLKHFSADSIKSERWTALLSFVCECMQRRGSTSVSRTAVGELRVEGRGRTLVKNTHLRSKLLDILGLFLPPRDGSASAAFRLDHQHPFVVHPTLSSVLVPSLLKLYSDVEFTGRHAQFYEKFTPRQQINELLECAWQYASHRATFERISQEAKNADFEKFVHTIISDSIFLLDESLKYLSQIREVEQLQANRASWDALTAEQRSDKEAALQSAEGTCKFMMQLSNGMFRLLGFLAPALTHTFTSDMFAQPLADMLNYYIKTLVGPAVQDLRVREPEKYEFRPKELLRDILRIFIACCGSERFQSCVVRDERSYSAEILSRTVGLVFRTNLLPRTEVAALEVIAGTLAKLSESAVDEVGDEDVPDEFFDPLTAALMSDPVVLPSKNVCDRRTIKRHLLTQQTDPFTQLPMSEDDLIDDAKLRGKIEQWTASRNSKTSNKQ